MFWFERHPLSELCLVVNPERQKGDGRYGFTDILLLSQNIKQPLVHGQQNATILELKNVTLKGLFAASGDKIYASYDDLKSLREVVSKESEAQLLERKFCYWDKGSNGWSKPAPIAVLKETASQQVTKYLKAMQNGKAMGATAGVLDDRICCLKGQTLLKGSILICIAGVRVLGYQVCSSLAQCVFSRQA
jgi:hypothetical protein